MTDADVPATDLLDWRPLVPGLIPQWHALLETATEADQGTEHLGPDDLKDELEPEWIDLGTDSVIGFDPDGLARAFGIVQVRPGDTTELRAHLWGVVHPDWRGRGIGRPLLDWQVRQARRIVAGRRLVLGEGTPATASFGVMENVQDAFRLGAAAGFRTVRWWSVMQRDLSKPLPEFDLPEGSPLRVVPFSPELDEKLRLAHNVAFEGHWHWQPWDQQTWRQWETGHRDFRADWTFAVLDGDEVAAYAMSAGYEGDWAALGYTEGWTGKLGVLPAHRGLGLAKVLLTASMRAFKESGMQYAGLDVDAANPTGAVALYEGLGYVVRQRSAQWSVDL